MQIVIDIPEETYKEVKWRGLHLCPRDEYALIDSIKNGKTLPEHHGRLIDADWVKNTLDIYVINEYHGQFIRRNDIDKVPTIIEAESEE